jgi:hypothetical protein
MGHGAQQGVDTRAVWLTVPWCTSHLAVRHPAHRLPHGPISTQLRYIYNLHYAAPSTYCSYAAPTS